MRNQQGTLADGTAGEWREIATQSSQDNAVHRLDRLLGGRMTTARTVTIVFGVAVVIVLWETVVFNVGREDVLQCTDEPLHRSHDLAPISLPAKQTSLTKEIDLHGIEPRVWPSWDTSAPLPCHPPDNEAAHDVWHSETPSKTGIIFIKPAKVGGSTLAGVNLRIAKNAAKRQKQPFEICKARFGHGLSCKIAADRIVGQSFMWTAVRHPNQRAISEFFHFEVSRGKVEPTDANFQAHLVSKKARSYHDIYLRLLSNKQRYNPGTAALNTSVQTVRSILDDYDFVAVTERMDESIVGLHMLLGVPLGDVLYLSAKTSGGYDDGRFRSQCYYIVPSFVSPGMQTFFATNEVWNNMSQWDALLHRLANLSLDKTIESLGRQRVENRLAEFRKWQHEMRAMCANTTVFPCDAGGKRMDKTDCLIHDVACGNACIDHYVKEHQLFTSSGRK